MVNPVWMPQPGSQTLFLNSDSVFEVLLEGNRGGGKTDALLMAFLKHVDKGYGWFWQGIIFRQTYKQLKDIKDKAHKWIPRMFPKAKFNETTNTWKFPDGEQLRFAHMRVPSDYENYHGHEYPFIGWEELTTWPNSDCYTRMMSCCRSSGPPEMPRIIRATTNPYGSGFNWVKKRFKLPSHRFVIWQDEEIDEETGLITIAKPRLAIQSRLTENQIFLAKNPGYIDTLRTSARNESELKAWVWGSWDITAGGMFDDVYDANVHLIKSFDPTMFPRGWRLDRAFDWGSASPFSVGWYAESDGSAMEHPFQPDMVLGEIRGDIYRFAEWYGSTGKPNEGLGLTASEIAEGIREREMAMGIWGRVRPGPADHNIFGDGTKGPTDHDAMKKKGVKFDKVKKGPYSRKNGWQLCRDRLANALPSEIGYREEPGLYIFDKCRHFIDLFPTMPRSEDDPDDIDKNAEDHIADEVSYRLRRISRAIQRKGF